MTNNNHYDQRGLGPLMSPGSQRKKKYNGSPRILSHYKQKRQNCQISKCGTARGKMSKPKIITDSIQMILACSLGHQHLYFQCLSLFLIILEIFPQNLPESGLYSQISNSGTARGKMSIPKMTARWWWLIMGMIIRLSNDFDFRPKYRGPNLAWTIVNRPPPLMSLRYSVSSP